MGPLSDAEPPLFDVLEQALRARAAPASRVATPAMVDLDLVDTGSPEGRVTQAAAAWTQPVNLKDR